jgi:hypothetical protein
VVKRENKHQGGATEEIALFDSTNKYPYELVLIV